MLSITTDYVTGEGNPRPYLRRIAEAGFTHVHWCHQWNTDYLYADVEIEQFGKWLHEYGLQLNDLHASQGREKYWLAPQAYRRIAGVELVANRIEMAARLGADVIIIHVPAEPKKPETNQIFWAQLQASLDDLEPVARSHGVRIAIENLTVDNFDTIEKIFARYGPDFVGLCYDAGHANIGSNRMERLEKVKDRLISLHLHDNDGVGDQHLLPFAGTVDWDRLTQLIATSAYTKCVSLEVVMTQTGIEEERDFLQQAFQCGQRLDEMVRAWKMEGGDSKL